jgi:hypothetical protein
MFARYRKQFEADPAWLAAKEAGEVHFVCSRPCSKGHTERYVASMSCVGCTRLANANRTQARRAERAVKGIPAPAVSLWMHPARLAAEKAGLKTFDPGYACVHGHHAERFVWSQQCVACTRLNNQRQKVKR